MKKLKLSLGIILVATCAAIPLAARADNSTNAPVKPYPLKTCLVCGMELGMMGQPYVFTNANQEIKLCSKSEKADFDKAPNKYMKKLADAEAKLKK
jgi:nitrous oxide reductase accessory protein NosL